MRLRYGDISMAARSKKTNSRKPANKKRITKKVSSKKKPLKKTASKKKTTQKKKIEKGTSNSNHASLWKAYKDLQAKIDDAWEKLQTDVKKKASAEVITAHKNQLLLLLGECNYMARECMKSAGETESSGQSATTSINIDHNPFKSQH